MATSAQSPLDTAVAYLGARPGSVRSDTGRMHGYTYFDDRSGRYWVSSDADVESLGEQLVSLAEAELAGEIDDDTGVTEAHIYDTWCRSTKSIKV